MMQLPVLVLNNAITKLFTVYNYYNTLCLSIPWLKSRDFKVTKSKPTNKHTLQLLMYWIMGQHSGKPEYKNLTNLGIFNPRLNTVYLLDMGNVSAKTIADVEKNVICYWFASYRQTRWDKKDGHFSVGWNVTVFYFLPSRTSLSAISVRLLRRFFPKTCYNWLNTSLFPSFDCRSLTFHTVPLLFP